MDFAAELIDRHPLRPFHDLLGVFNEQLLLFVRQFAQHLTDDIDVLTGDRSRSARDPGVRHADAGIAIERLGIGRLGVASVQRSAREVDHDPDEGRMVADADLRRGERGRCGGGRERGERKEE